jgi:cytoskeletal protein CcmA (bactofilin family)
MAIFNNDGAKATELGSAVTPQGEWAPLSGAAAEKTQAGQTTVPSNGKPTYLDATVKVSGKLTFEAPVVIDGQIDGEINALQTSVAVGKTATIKAKIQVQSITVGGVVDGEINASQRIELQPSAKVKGSLTAPKIVIMDGALFDGTCSMQPKAQRDDARKPGVASKEERPMAATNGQDHTAQAGWMTTHFRKRTGLDSIHVPPQRQIGLSRGV